MRNIKAGCMDRVNSGNIAMPQDTQKIIGQIAARVFTSPLADYLSSDRFLRVCREEDLEDIWKEYLELSRDRPDLFGDAVIRNAFVLFLHHIFHHRQAEFPALLTGILMDFSRETDQSLPFKDLKTDVLKLGYPLKDLEEKFSSMRADEEEREKRRKTGCPG
jgi:hypothetical protein